MDAKELLESRRYLSEIGLWPSRTRLDLDGWSANFDEGADVELAHAFLESHVHIGEEQIIHAVASTLRGISSGDEFGEPAERALEWTTFLDRLQVSFPLSRSGDTTASGYVFARIAERLGFRENQIHDSEHLVARLKVQEPVPVVFLDDLAASGVQFTRNWTRNYETAHGKRSLAKLRDEGALSAVHYLPIVCTRAAKEKIESECAVNVSPTYLLDDDYQATDAETRLVPARLRAAIGPFLAKYSPLTGRAGDGDAGYGDLGLALSFHHGCPNNTLPVLQWAPMADEWKALVS